MISSSWGLITAGVLGAGAVSVGAAGRLAGAVGGGPEVVAEGAAAQMPAERMILRDLLTFPVDVTGGDLIMPNGFGGNSNARGAGRHNGVDIGNGCVPGHGRRLLACADAVVVGIDGSSRTAGNVIILRDGIGNHFRYHHLAAFVDGLVVGDRVEAGQLVGFMGSTGNTQWAHLHFEMWVGGLSPQRGGMAVDPEPLLPLPVLGVSPARRCT